MAERARWLTVRQYCDFYNVHRKTVAKWVALGYLPFYRHGRILRVEDRLPSQKPANYVNRKQ